MAEAWAADAAVLPIDPRLPATAQRGVIQRALPTVLEDEAGHRLRVQGRPVARGIGLAIATSGSTGAPATVLLERQALCEAITRSAQRLSLDGERWCCPLPVAHIAGMLIVLRAHLLGVDVDYGADLLSTEATWASVVPTQLARFVAGETPLHGRHLLVGGAHLDPSLRLRVEGLGAKVVHTYGMTETAGGIVYDGFALEGVEIRIDLTGRVSARSPTLATAIRRPAADDPLALEDGWLRTRDRGRIQDSRLIVEGRIDPVINTGGEKLDPRALTDELETLAGVTRARAFGEPDEVWGTRLIVEVEAPGVSDLTILDHLRSAFGPAGKPARIRRIGSGEGHADS